MKLPSSIKLTLILGTLFWLIAAQAHAEKISTGSGVSQMDGVKDGYRYELWNQDAEGEGTMVIGEGALFSGVWKNVFNYLARRGLAYDETQHHSEIGAFSAKYDCTYVPSEEPSGNSYLSIYGWTVDPLAEFYIVEDWRRWIPSMADDSIHQGSIEVDGSIYDIYQAIRTEQPSIRGTQTFPQYFSIRRDTRNQGAIDISAHFDKWESLGMKMGKMYEVSFVVEGYKSSGEFEFTELEITVDPPTAE